MEGTDRSHRRKGCSWVDKGRPSLGPALDVLLPTGPSLTRMTELAKFADPVRRRDVKPTMNRIDLVPVPVRTDTCSLVWAIHEYR